MTAVIVVDEVETGNFREGNLQVPSFLEGSNSSDVSDARRLCGLC